MNAPLLAFQPGSVVGRTLVIAIAVGAVVAFVVAMLVPLIAAWFRARRAGHAVRLLDLVMMRFRKVNVRLVVTDWLRMRAAGVDLPLDAVESHALAGGRTSLVADAMITGVREGFGDDPDRDLWSRTCALDHCGLNVRFMMEAAVAARTPALFDLPSPLTDDPRARQFDDPPRFEPRSV